MQEAIKTLLDRQPPTGVWMSHNHDDDLRIALMVTYKKWDGEQHVWVAWVPMGADPETMKFGADILPGHTTIEFRQPTPEWDHRIVSEKDYMPFEIACEGIRNMTGLGDDVQLRFAFLSTFKIQIERVDGEDLPNIDEPKTVVSMPYPVARPGVRTNIGSM